MAQNLKITGSLEVAGGGEFKNNLNAPNLHLYQHTLKLGSNNAAYITTSVLTNTATALSFGDFCKWLQNNGFTDSGTSSENTNGRYWCTGAGYPNYTTQCSSPDGSTLRIYNGAWNQAVVQINSPQQFKDFVVKIF